MKLSDIKGKKQLKVVGKLMELASTLEGDKQLESFIEAVRGDGKERAFLQLGPVLTRDEVADGIIDILAYAKGVSPEEVDSPVAEIMELITEDIELPAFLSEQQ